jgi:arylsulfatase A-like enzyme
MNRLTYILAVLAVSGLKIDQVFAGQEKPSKKNILFIMLDDLRPELGCYGQSHIKSPNIDKLASEGVVFNNAYCQVPVCGASRASIMTGLRPAGQRFWQWDCKAEVDAPDAPTMNSFFKENGYYTISNGKIFHYVDDSKDGWSEAPYLPTGKFSRFGYLDPENIPKDKGDYRGPAFEGISESDDEYVVGKVLSKSLDDLKKLKEKGQPFFLAVGFYKPHLPFVAPKKYWDLYEKENIQLPPNPVGPVNAPARSLHNFGELRAYSNIPGRGQTGPLSIPLSRDLIHGYYACVSYVDALVGRLLAELDNQGLAENTIVVLLGDHGWNLLDHGLWCKHSNYETSLRPAFLMKVPGMEKGLKSDAIVEFVDIFPSLCELTRLAPPENLAGVSLKPLLSGEKTKVKDYAFSRWYAGHSVISKDFIYTEWWNDKNETLDKMLYDHRSDPGENYNVAGDPGYENIVSDLSGKLRNSFEIKE